MVVCVWVVPPGESSAVRNKQRYIVRVSPYCTPDQLVYEVIRKRLVPQGLMEQQLIENCKAFQRDFLLKICGLDDYLLHPCPINQYKVSHLND